MLSWQGRNTRLIEESEALLMRCQAGSDAQSPSPPALKKGRKGLFPFRKCALPLSHQHCMLLDLPDPSDVPAQVCAVRLLMLRTSGIDFASLS